MPQRRTARTRARQQGIDHRTRTTSIAKVATHRERSHDQRVIRLCTVWGVGDDALPVRRCAGKVCPFKRTAGIVQRSPNIRVVPSAQGGSAPRWECLCGAARIGRRPTTVCERSTCLAGPGTPLAERICHRAAATPLAQQEEEVELAPRQDPRAEQHQHRPDPEGISGEVSDVRHARANADERTHLADKVDHCKEDHGCKAADLDHAEEHQQANACARAQRSECTSHCSNGAAGADHRRARKQPLPERRHHAASGVQQGKSDMSEAPFDGAPEDEQKQHVEADMRQPGGIVQKGIGHERPRPRGNCGCGGDENPP